MTKAGSNEFWDITIAYCGFSDEEWNGIVASSLQQRRQYEKFEIDPPGSPWIEGVDRENVYPRACYMMASEYAYHIARSFQEYKVVHGDTSLVVGGHAWVDLPNNLVFDGVYQRFYRRDDYYGQMAHAKSWYIYDREAFRILHSSLEDSLGQWWDRLGLPMIFDRPPIEVSGDYAHELLAKHVIRSGEAALRKWNKTALVRFAERLGLKPKVGKKLMSKADVIRLLLESPNGRA